MVEDGISERPVMPVELVDEEAQKFMARYLVYGAGAAFLLLLWQVSPVVFGHNNGQTYGFFRLSLGIGILLLLLQWLSKKRLLTGHRMTAAVLSPLALITANYLWHLSTEDTPTSLVNGMAIVFAVALFPVGLSINRRLALWAGLFGALGHQAAIDIARFRGLLLDGTPYGLYVMGSIFVFIFGVGIWLLAGLSRQILRRALEEERARIRESEILGAYFSQEVKKKLLQGGTRLAPERHDVAILFSDIRGFTRWADNRDPAEVTSLLNEYFDAMVNVIRTYGGTVDKFIGDAILAVFGGVRTIETPCEAAVRCAQAMRRKMTELHLDWEQRGLPLLDMGIGIHSGEVVQGPVGSRERLEFTVIGDTVNVAARIESMTKELGQPILVSSTVEQAVGPRIRKRLSKAGDFEVRGKRALVTLFQVNLTPDSEDWNRENSMPAIVLPVAGKPKVH